MRQTRNHKSIKNKTRKNKRVFTKSDYKSGDGMLTTVWGPSLWHYLHTMSFNYPIHPSQEDKNNYFDFMMMLQYVLPCKYCRVNLTKNYKHLPLMKSMENRETFSRYVYNLHELVNKMLNKKSHLSYCDIRERYEHFRSRCTLDETKSNIFKFSNNKMVTNPKKKNKEKGCTEPLYGKKSKCIIRIVPQEEKGPTFQMDRKCIKTRKRT